MFAYFVPAVFFIGILCRVIRHGRAEGSTTLYAEPVVLLFIGLVFMAANAPYVDELATAMQVRLYIEPHAGGGADMGEDWFHLAFGLGAIAVLATLAKAFWTHVILEENQWGPLAGYRSYLWSNKIVGWFEYFLRCVIAVLIVLTQKGLSEVQDVKHIDDTKAIISDEEASNEFVTSFLEWLWEFSLYGFWLYAFICIWLSLVAWRTVHEPRGKRAAWYTATSTIPALLIAWIMFVLATGRVIPNPFETYVPGNPPGWLIMSVSSFLFVLSLLVFLNVAYTAFTGPGRELGGLWRQFRTRRDGGGAEEEAGLGPGGPPGTAE
jgi:hypothetical protein